jgi:hypothetical protein
MKKQTNILNESLSRPQPRRKEWMLIAVIVALISKNQSNRSVPTGTLPLNALKETLVTFVSDAEKMVSKLANLFYNVTGESFITALHLITFAGLVVSMVLAVYYSRIK